jgi:hypothetical protein
MPNFFPVVDSYIHPKTPDLKYFADMHESGVTNGVILTTDADSKDAERPKFQHAERSVLQHDLIQSMLFYGHSSQPGQGPRSYDAPGPMEDLQSCC